MIDSFELEEVDYLRRLLEAERGKVRELIVVFDRIAGDLKIERERMRTLVEMLHQLGVEVYFMPDGVTVTNAALEAPCPGRLGPGYMGLGSAGD